MNIPVPTAEMPLDAQFRAHALEAERSARSSENIRFTTIAGTAGYVGSLGANTIQRENFKPETAATLLVAGLLVGGALYYAFNAQAKKLRARAHRLYALSSDTRPATPRSHS